MMLRKPNFKYLQYCASLEEVKREYRRKAIVLHPDKPTGNLIEMQQLNIEFDYIKNNAYITLPIERKNINNNTSSFDTLSGFEKFKRAAEQQERERREREKRQTAYKKPDTKDTEDYVNRKYREWKENQRSKNSLNWEEFVFVIESLLTEAKAKNRKSASCWYSFIEYLQENNYKTNKKQLEYIATKLNYHTGWAYFKKEELIKQGLYE